MCAVVGRKISLICSYSFLWWQISSDSSMPDCNSFMPFCSTVLRFRNISSEQTSPLVIGSFRPDECDDSTCPFRWCRIEKDIFWAVPSVQFCRTIRRLRFLWYNVQRSGGMEHFIPAAAFWVSFAVALQRLFLYGVTSRIMYNKGPVDKVARRSFLW